MKESSHERQVEEQVREELVNTLDNIGYERMRVPGRWVHMISTRNATKPTTVEACGREPSRGDHLHHGRVTIFHQIEDDEMITQTVVT